MYCEIPVYQQINFFSFSLPTRIDKPYEQKSYAAVVNHWQIKANRLARSLLETRKHDINIDAEVKIYYFSSAIPIACFTLV